MCLSTWRMAYTAKASITGAMTDCAASAMSAADPASTALTAVMTAMGISTAGPRRSSL